MSYKYALEEDNNDTRCPSFLIHLFSLLGVDSSKFIQFQKLCQGNPSLEFSDLLQIGGPRGPHLLPPWTEYQNHGRETSISQLNKTNALISKQIDEISYFFQKERWPIQLSMQLLSKACRKFFGPNFGRARNQVRILRTQTGPFRVTSAGPMNNVYNFLR